MRVTHRTPGTLVIEEGSGTQVMIGVAAAAIGAVLAGIGWTNGRWLFAIIGAVFALWGLRALFFGRTRTHRFERGRDHITIASKGLWKTAWQELPLESIADVVLEEVRGRSSPSYYVYYVTTHGQRIRWCDSFDGSKETTVECFEAAREFLGLP